MLSPILVWACASLLAPAGRPAQAAAGPHIVPDLPAESANLAAKVDRYFAAIAVTLDARPREVLRRIPNRQRRMLAVTEYLRRHDQVDTLWTWTAQEGRRYRLSRHYRRAMSEVRQVRRAFAGLNPGYVLVTDTNVRPLRTQVVFWNRERSVAAAARELHDSGRVWLSDDSYPDFPDSAALARFIGQVVTYQPARLPTVAVPGLSYHGRLRAFDFAVLRRAAGGGGCGIGHDRLGLGPGRVDREAADGGHPRR
jgi:hypothetical protein